MSIFLRIAIWVSGISLIIWAFTGPEFRDSEGFIKGSVCLPISAGLALIVLGWSITTKLRRFAFWFTLAFVGQAVTLQMIDAGTRIHYQHYRTLYILLTESPVLLMLFIVQTVFVIMGIRKIWPQIKEWISYNLKIWQLLGMGSLLFLSSAAVSREITNYVYELFFATFIQAINLGNIILMVMALPEDILAVAQQKITLFWGQNNEKDETTYSKVDSFVTIAAVWIVSIAGVLAFFAYERLPHIPDEVMYYYQARYFAEGVLSVPAPPVADAFSFYLIPHEASEWYSIFPPGWPAMLAVGFILGVPWLVNPVLGGLNILLIYFVFTELHSRRSARIALFLLCTSPWYVFMCMNFMSHTFTLTCVLIAVLAIVQVRKSGKIIWGCIGGSAVGVISLIRPIDGLIAAAVLGLWAIGLGGKRLKVTTITAFVFSIIVIGSIVFLYNKHITGSANKFPLMEYYEEYHGHNTNALGFGPERGLGWPLDPFPGHGPVDALINAMLNIFSINIELFGWSIGSFIIVVFLLFSGKMNRSDYFMLFTILGIAGTFSLYWFNGGPDFGARYWYLMIIPLVALTIKGIDILKNMFASNTSGLTMKSTRVVAAIFSLSIFVLINYLPWRAIDKYHHYLEMRPDIRYLSEKYHFGKSLVLIRGKDTDYRSAWTYNPLDPDADAPIYAWDRNPEIRNQLFKAYPDRSVWLLDGPTINKGSFKVIDGPLSHSELMAQ